MGFHSSGGVIVKDTFTGIDTTDAFVEFLRLRLTEKTSDDTYSGPFAGWEKVSRIKAQITFTLEAFLVDDSITVFDKDGVELTAFVVWHPDSPGSSGNVLYDPDPVILLSHFGAAASDIYGWTSTIDSFGGNYTIKFENILHNLMTLQTHPTGTVGFFDFNPSTNPGEGKTWGAGYRVRSQKIGISAVPLTLDITTSSRPTPGIKIEPLENTTPPVAFDLLPGAWIILANRYQMFLVLPGVTTGPSFFLASHLKPGSGLSFCNFISGSVYGTGGLNGGRRTNFSTPLALYYVNNGSPFTSSGATVAVPVWGHGITAIEKTGQVKLSGLPVRNDLGNFAVFDAFIVACRLESEIEQYLIGSLWDSLIYSQFLEQDASSQALINGGYFGYIMISQTGGDPFSLNSPGSLVVQESNEIV